jgi:hypothetical protein
LATRQLPVSRRRRLNDPQPRRDASLGGQPLAQHRGGPVGVVEEEAEPGDRSQPDVRIGITGEFGELRAPLSQEGDSLRAAHRGQYSISVPSSSKPRSRDSRPMLTSNATTAARSGVAPSPASSNRFVASINVKIYSRSTRPSRSLSLLTPRLRACQN